MKSDISLKNINRLAIPAIFAGIIEPIIALSDTLIAGNLPHGELNLGVVGLVGAFISALVWILAQTKTAISTYISQALGANQLTQAKPLFSQLFLFNFLLSLVLAISTFYGAHTLFALQNAEGELLEKATDFYRIRVWGFPFTLLTFTIFGAFRGIQNTFWAMLCSVTGGLLNIGLNYYFAIHRNWGLEGIAYASLIAQGTMLLLALFFLFRNTPFRLTPIWPIHPQFWSMMTMSFNLFLRAFFLNVCFWIANYFATSYGKISLATHTIMIQIWLLSAFLLDGYSNAANAISGKLYGANAGENIRLLSKKLVRIMLLISFILMGVYALSYTQLIRWFTDNEEIITLFKKYFWIVIVMMPINALAFLYDGIFKGMGKAVYLRNVLFFATFIVFLPCVILWDHLFHNLYAVWWAIWIWMMARTVPLIWRLAHNR